MWTDQLASRLRASRRVQKLGQDHVAEALDVSVSEISRLERGIRSLRVEQIEPWADALGCKIQTIMWQERDGESRPWDDSHNEVLAEVAATLPLLPLAAREALIEEMRIWRKHVKEAANTPDLDTSEKV